MIRFGSFIGSRKGERGLSKEAPCNIRTTHYKTSPFLSVYKLHRDGWDNNPPQCVPYANRKGKSIPFSFPRVLVEAKHS